jgi:hypothetical protein
MLRQLWRLQMQPERIRRKRNKPSEQPPFHPQGLETHYGIDLGEKMRLWTYGCKSNELPRAILPGLGLPAVPSKRQQ